MAGLKARFTFAARFIGRPMLLVPILVGSIVVTGFAGQSPAAPNPSAFAHKSPYKPSHFPRRATLYYQEAWGVDSPAVRSVESGELIRFNYLVLDAAKASRLNDKKVEPILIDPRAGVKLVIPSLEKVGQLRQSSSPEAGKVYWMAFSNKGGRVKRGDRVDVVIGQFHATGLVVE
jgi:hypothetical protein